MVLSIARSRGGTGRSRALRSVLVATMVSRPLTSTRAWRTCSAACLKVDVRPAQPADLLAAQAQQLHRCGVPRRGQTPISLICISLDARHEGRTERSKGHHWP
jgi:hypothetical protein